MHADASVSCEALSSDDCSGVEDDCRPLSIHRADITVEKTSHHFFLVIHGSESGPFLFKPLNVSKVIELAFEREDGFVDGWDKGLFVELSLSHRVVPFIHGWVAILLGDWNITLGVACSGVEDEWSLWLELFHRRSIALAKWPDALPGRVDLAKLVVFGEGRELTGAHFEELVDDSGVVPSLMLPLCMSLRVLDSIGEVESCWSINDLYIRLNWLNLQLG